MHFFKLRTKHMHIWQKNPFDTSQTTASLGLHEFCKAVVNFFEYGFLREPSDVDLACIAPSFAKVGFLVLVEYFILQPGNGIIVSRLSVGC